MRAFVSHETALAYWRSHFPLDSELGVPAYASSAQECASKKADVLGCVMDSLVVPGEPVDVLVFEAGSRRDSASVKCRLWGCGIPANAFYRVGFMMVSSPEFVFLQMARDLSVAQLAALGCELCGMYALNREDVGFQESFDACPTRMTPLTSVEKLKSFIETTSGAPGTPKAMRALKYVVEGSRSPMETMTCLYLTLPPMLGGYGFKKPAMNATIELNEAARKIAQRHYCQGDLCWPECKLDIEYHGEVHVGAAQMKSDVGRALGIEHMGWRVITVTSSQVRSAERFEVVAREAARHMRFRLRKSVLGETAVRSSLRQQLEEWTFGNGV